MEGDPKGSEDHGGQEAKKRPCSEECCGQGGDSWGKRRSHHQMQELWAQVWGRWWEVLDHTTAGERSCPIRQGLEEGEVLHMQVHQERIEIGGHTQDHSQGFEQEWL